MEIRNSDCYENGQLDNGPHGDGLVISVSSLSAKSPLSAAESPKQDETDVAA